MMSKNKEHLKTAWEMDDSKDSKKSNTTKDNKPSLSERLREHAGSSNVHGISHIFSRRTRFRRFIWITPFLTLTVFSMYQFMNIYLLYISYPTQTNVKLQFKPLKFPFISLCNMNPIRKSQLGNLRSNLLKRILEKEDISSDIGIYLANLKIALQSEEDILNVLGDFNIAIDEDMNMDIDENYNYNYDDNNINNDNYNINDDENSNINDVMKTNDDEGNNMDYTNDYNYDYNTYDVEHNTNDYNYDDDYNNKDYDSINTTLDSDEHGTDNGVCVDCDEDYKTETSGDLVDSLIIKELYYLAMESLSREEKRTVGHQLKDMLMSCHFSGSDCTLNVSGFFSMYYGNCYTIDTSKYIAGTAAPSSGLTMTINLETAETVKLTEGYGTIVMLHEKGEIVFPESDGIVVSGGTETHIKMKLTQIERQGPPYSDCENKQYIRDNIKYTVSECFYECMYTIYLEKCECVLTSAIYDMEQNDSRNCRNTTEDYICAKKWYTYVLKDTDKYCKCPPPCRENVYVTSISSRKWPTETHLEELKLEVCEDNNKCSLSSATSSQLESNFLKLLVYFEDLNHEVIEEVPLYDATQLLSDIGGSVGLCLGVSLLCLVELIEVMLEIFEELIRKIANRFKSSIQDVEPLQSDTQV